MAELDLCDFLNLDDFELLKNNNEVTVEILNGGGEFSFIFNDIPSEKNLITIAVKKYMESIGRGGHFVFSITKNIPSGAGLGGGSSNAAAALKIISGLMEEANPPSKKKGTSEPVSDAAFFMELYAHPDF